MRPSLTKGRFFSVACFCLILGLLIRFSVAAHLRLGEDEMSNTQRMERWLLSGKVVSLCLMLSAFSLLARSRARLLIGIIAVLFSGLLLFGRPSPEYFDLRTPGRYAAESCQTFAIPLGIGIVLLIGALLKRRPSDSPESSGEGRSRRAFFGRVAVAGGALIVGLLTIRIPALLAIGLGIVAWLIVEIANLGQRPTRLPRWFAVAVLCLGALGFIEKNYLLVTKEFVRAIVCVDRDTGRVKWMREGLKAPQPTTNVRNSPATPTPVVEAGRVYAWFGSPGCMCTDLEGNLLWTNTDAPFEGFHGVGASPIPCDGLLLIVGAQPEAPCIRALDCQTGEPAWTTGLRPWPGVEGQHRTPTVKTVDGKNVLLVWGWDGPDKEDHLRAYDVRSGKELWKYPVKTWGEGVASTISDGETLYLPSSQRFYALSLSGLSQGQDPVLWTTDMKTKGPDVASPVVCNGLLFMVSRHRHAACLDAKTGEVLWRQRLRGRGCLASVVAIGKHVYFADTSGLTTVVACERRFRKVAENDLKERIFASPAPVDGRLFIRTTKHLWCIQE